MCHINNLVNNFVLLETLLDEINDCNDVKDKRYCFYPLTNFDI